MKTPRIVEASATLKTWTLEEETHQLRAPTALQRGKETSLVAA